MILKSITNAVWGLCLFLLVLTVAVACMELMHIDSTYVFIAALVYVAFSPRLERMELGMLLHIFPYSAAISIFIFGLMLGTAAGTEDVAWLLPAFGALVSCCMSLFGWYLVHAGPDDD